MSVTAARPLSFSCSVEVRARRCLQGEICCQSAAKNISLYGVLCVFMRFNEERSKKPAEALFKHFKREKSGDPNGIRTRVSAVKGRCPRPLDDRVFLVGLAG